MRDSGEKQVPAELFVPTPHPNINPIPSLSLCLSAAASFHVVRLKLNLQTGKAADA